MAFEKRLQQRILNKEAVIGVIGLGYVGLPIVRAFSVKGFPVVGFDIDAKKVASLQAGRSYIQHLPHEEIAACIDRGFKPTDDFSKIRDVDAIIICVPTPLNKNMGPDLQYIKNTMDQILPYIKAGQIFVSREHNLSWHH